MAMISRHGPLVDHLILTAADLEEVLYDLAQMFQGMGSHAGHKRLRAAGVVSCACGARVQCQAIPAQLAGHIPIGPFRPPKRTPAVTGLPGRVARRGGAA